MVIVKFERMKKLLTWIESTLHKQIEIITVDKNNPHERIMLKMLRFWSLNCHWWWIRSCSMREMHGLESDSPYLIFNHHHLPAWCGLWFCSQYPCTARTSESLPISKNGACGTPLLSYCISGIGLWRLCHFMSYADSLTWHYERIISFYNITSTNHLFMQFISIG